MPKFSRRSTRNLQGLHPDLVYLLKRAILQFDFTILTGRRTREEQQRLFLEGKSKTLNSRHLFGRAVDITPWHWEKPHIRFDDTASHYLLAGFILGLAEKLEVPIRWGGAWAGWPLPDCSDENVFDDLVHFELI